MTKRWFVSMGLGLALAGTAQAQRVVPEVLSVSPYVGYMNFGQMLTGPVGSWLGYGSARVVGGEATLAIAPGIALVGNVGYASPSLQAGWTLSGPYSIGSGDIWMYDGGLQLSAGKMRGATLSFTPFLQAGLGAARARGEIAGFSNTSTTLTGNIGAGADVEVVPNVSVRLFAKDYIGTFDFRQSTYGAGDAHTTHNLMFGAGLKMSL